MADVVIPLSRFAARFAPGNPQRVWIGPLRMMHGTEKHTVEDWQALIETLKAQPVPRD